MIELRWTNDGVELRRPILIVAFAGLFDAAGAATAAVTQLGRIHDSVEIADIDPETFFNFTEQRPLVRLGDDGHRVLEWPSNSCRAARVDDSPHDLLLLAGIEPHLRWRTFGDALCELAKRMGAEMVITLGAMVGMAPHTRPLGVVGSAADADVAHRLGLGSPSYEGPTGLIGALNARLDTEGLPVVSLRVSVPHYVPGAPNAEATRSLLARLELMTGIPTGHAELDEAAREWRTRIDTAVANDPDLSEYVTQLEGQVDRAEILPTGDDLATELEAFLRDRRDDG